MRFQRVIRYQSGELETHPLIEARRAFVLGGIEYEQRALARDRDANPASRSNDVAMPRCR